jgi:hypothetical protein
MRLYYRTFYGPAAGLLFELLDRLQRLVRRFKR